MFARTREQFFEYFIIKFTTASKFNTNYLLPQTSCQFVAPTVNLLPEANSF